jgi:hypothetical protein
MENGNVKILAIKAVVAFRKDEVESNITGQR